MTVAIVVAFLVSFFPSLIGSMLIFMHPSVVLRFLGVMLVIFASIQGFLFQSFYTNLAPL